MADSVLCLVLCCSLEQLELIEYVIAENLADILKGLSQLKKFSVWTNTETRVRTSAVCLILTDSPIYVYTVTYAYIHRHTVCTNCMNALIISI